MTNDKGLFERMPPCLWQIAGETITLPVIRIEMEGGNRIVEHPRPYQDGEKCDDTGTLGEVIVLIVDWFNGNREPDVDGDVQYPDSCNRMILSCKKHEVGTLRLPTIGNVRCRARNWKRVETSEERDAAQTQFTFKVDNEDAITDASFTSPSARSVARSVAEDAVFSAERAGVDLSDFGTSLLELAQGIEDLSNAPAEQLAALNVQALKVRAACEHFEQAHTNVLGAGGGLLRFAPHNLVIRNMRKLSDMAARVIAERLSALPPRQPIVFAEQRSLFDVAAKYNVDFTELLRANPQLGNPFAIPPYTPIHVDAAALAAQKS